MTTVIQFIKDLFLLKYFPELGHDASFGLLFLLGALTSFHCIAMCGGIAISQTIGNKQERGVKEGGRHAWLLPSILYNVGRTAGYTLAGGIVGGLGQAISFTGVWKGVIPIIGGLFMVIMGINLLGIFTPLRRLNIRMPYFAAKKIKEKNNYGPFYIGLLSGLMPCGPLQIVQLYALGTQSIFYGALSMLIFALGTVPLLFAFGALNSIINKKYANRILKLSAVFVIVLGVVMIGRGLALSNIYVPLPGGSINVSSGAAGAAKIEGHVQKVATSIKSDSYPPIIVQRGIPVQWTIHADEDQLNECNNEITIPKFKIDMKLQEGDNLIEFTPQETGEYVYTCWMGMIKSKITVVDEIAATALNHKEESEPAQKNEDNKDTVKEEAKIPEPHEEKDSKAAISPSPAPSPAPSPVPSVAPSAAPDAVPSIAPVTSPNAHAPKSEDAVLTGYLIDKHCFGQVNPGKETRTCLTMEDCELSGYGIAVKQEDGQYKFYLFDANGHKLSKDYLSGAAPSTGFPIRVIGRQEGEIFKVMALSENDK